MNMNAIFGSAMFLLAAPLAMAEAYPYSEFVQNAGLHKGYALACGLEQAQIAAYENSVKTYTANNWPEDYARDFQSKYESAAAKAKNDRKRSLDEVFCRGIQLTLSFGADHPASSLTHEFLARHDRSVEFDAKSKKTAQEAAALRRRQRVEAAKDVRKLVSTNGARVCRQDTGKRRDVVGTSFGQPLYGRSVEETFQITGFTEGVNGDRIKVMVSSIRIASTGRYIETLPPDYTKGIHVWQDFFSWEPC